MHFKFNFCFLIFQVNLGIQTFVSGTDILRVFGDTRFTSLTFTGPGN